MNTSIVISFVIGGILLLSIIAYNQMVMENTQENTLSIITHQNLDNAVDLISSDFERIGYDPEGNLGEDDYIVTYQDKQLVFRGDVYSGDAIGDTTVTWLGDTSDLVNSTRDPNDFYLSRTGPVDSTGTIKTSKIPVVYFNLTYYDQTGNPSPTMSRFIYKIKAELVVESPEPIRVNNDGEEIYYKAIWNRTFTPNHLNKRQF